MDWNGIAAIVLSITLANHLGLIEAIEGVIGHKLPILNCSMCGGFWLTLIYTLLTCNNVFDCVAVSFFVAYAAIWLELSFGIIDKIYNFIYESIYTKEADDTADTKNQVS